MNYEKIYDRIIKKAVLENRKKSKDQYFERHHIIPKCLGGSNEKENLVLLTAREHFICHRLLCEIHPYNKKLWYALDAMLILNSDRNYTIGSRLYSIVKENIRECKSEFLRINNPMKAEHLRNKKSKEMSGNSNLIHRLTDEQRRRHAVNVSLSKIGAKNPNSKKCMFLASGETFDSGADMIRKMNLKITANYAVKIGIVKWIL
jgi:hypothetical protein